MLNLLKWTVSLAPVFGFFYLLSGIPWLAGVLTSVSLLFVGALSDYAVLSCFSNARPPTEEYAASFERARNAMLLRGVLPPEGLSILLVCVPEPRPFVTVFRTALGKMGIVASYTWLAERDEEQLASDFERLIVSVSNSKWVLPTTAFLFLRLAWWGLGSFRELLFSSRASRGNLTINRPVGAFLRFVFVLPVFRIVRWITDVSREETKGLEHGIELLI